MRKIYFLILIGKKVRICCIEVNGFTGRLMDIASATVYMGFIHKEEIATISISKNIESGEYKYSVKLFKVKQVIRNQGVGRKLMDCMVEEVQKTGGNQIVVFPKSDPYKGEEEVKPQLLYEIYERLGFRMTEPMVDRTKPNNEMTMKLEKKV